MEAEWCLEHLRRTRPITCRSTEREGDLVHDLQSTSGNKPPSPPEHWREIQRLRDHATYIAPHSTHPSVYFPTIYLFSIESMHDYSEGVGL